MFGLFNRRPVPRPVVTVRLNARLQPVDRGDAFEDPLDHWLRRNGLGEVVGGGTAFTPGEGVQSCDIEIGLTASDDETFSRLTAQLVELGAPAGSKLILESGEERDVGVHQGLALHLNGVDLPDEVYEACDLDDLLEKLDSSLEARGRVLSHYDGPRETSLFLYGPSYAEMADAIAPVLASYPLCQQSRLEKIA